jgi:hypothetical protein
MLTQSYTEVSQSYTEEYFNFFLCVTLWLLRETLCIFSLSQLIIGFQGSA